MNIMIAGLGLIGGSMALALKTAGIQSDGFDREDVLSYALQENMIARAARDFMEYDVVFVALPPKAAVRFLTENSFKKGAVVADVCGVKGAIERAVSDKPRDYRYVGCHPMAGKEVSGIRNADASLFRGASMILVENDRTDPAAAETIAALSVSMGFDRVIRCDSDYHDAKIAYTSQLAHIVSNAYVKSPTGGWLPRLYGRFLSGHDAHRGRGRKTVDGSVFRQPRKNTLRTAPAHFRIGRVRARSLGGGR